jgi:hypothetical protein
LVSRPVFEAVQPDEVDLLGRVVLASHGQHPQGPDTAAQAELGNLTRLEAADSVINQAIRPWFR